MNHNSFIHVSKLITTSKHPCMNVKRKLILYMLLIPDGIPGYENFKDGVPSDVLSKWTCLSKLTFKKHLKVLIDEGFVVMTGRDKYQLNQKALLS